MNAAVSYYSKTGHSKKIAEAIADELKIPMIDLRNELLLNKEEPLDLLLVLGGLYGGKSAPEMLAAARRIKPQAVKQVVLMTSCMNPEGRQDEVRRTLREQGVDVAAEEFNCRGGFLFFSRKHPNRDDIAAAVNFASDVLAKVARTSIA